jgi:ferredoxin
MKVVVDENACVGTGNCELACPKVFKVVGGVSKVLVDVVPKEEEARVKEAVDGCPMDAIHIA